MKHKRPSIPVLILLGLLLLLAGYFIIDQLMNRNEATLTASGTIEAISITISPEIGGKVVEVFVDEGDFVVAGETLFRLDDTLLQAQRAVAIATLDLAVAAQESTQAARNTAQANYDLAAAAAHAESVSTRTDDWNSGFTSTITQSEELTIAKVEYDAALLARDLAQETLSNLISDPGSSDFVAAETRLLNANTIFTIAQQVLQSANISSSAKIREEAQANYDLASNELDSAQEEYNNIKDTDPAQAILNARASLAVSQERLYAAQDLLLALQIGDYSLRLTAAAAVLRQAESSLSQAELAVAQAQANLELVDVQISRLTITAPIAGIIQTRAIQPGEVIPAASAAIKIIRMDDLTITVYIPEDRYGEVSLGQSAMVKVDSFPDDVFLAAVTFISGEAEFTPRNVQTVEGRSSTVYAIRLRVEDPAEKLKSGMPADVTFEIDE